MAKNRYRIPSTSALQAFEAAARHCNFSRAANELHTSQSAISRHIATLEARFDCRLFDRHKKKRLVLTHAGAQLYRAVVSGFDHIQSAIEAISASALDEKLTIACTHEVSHLFLLPRFESLQQQLGADRQIRIMTYEYDVMEIALDPQIDIVILYDVTSVDPRDRVRIVPEAVTPLASPLMIERYPVLASRNFEAWRDLPFLELSKQNYGWATWQDWADKNALRAFEPAFSYFNNYVYLLEAAAVGKGLALGWRGLIERYLDNGALVALTEDYLEFDRGIHAVLTGHGRGKQLARHCLECLAGNGDAPSAHD